MKGFVIDKDSKQPLYMATISLADASGKPIGKAVTSGSDGEFSIYTNAEVSRFSGQQKLEKLQITFIGYETLVQDAIDGATYELKPMTIGLDEVVIEGKKNAKNFWSKNKGLVIFVGALGLGYLGYKLFYKK